jgi:quercetin dioxygenase-like cupin family protein
LVSYKEGAVVSRIILKREAGNVTLFAFDAGQELSEHTTPYDALVQVVDGEAAITIAGRPYRLRAGDMIIMPGHQPHAPGTDMRASGCRPAQQPNTSTCVQESSDS